MTTIKTVFAFTFLLTYSSTTSGQLKLADLLKVYNSNSINVAYRNISILPSFKGSISIDSITKDSIIIGIIKDDSILISRLKNKSKIELTTFKKSLFQSIREQANLKLHFNGDYKRGSKEVSRHYYAYSNKLIIPVPASGIEPKNYSCIMI